MAKLKKQEIIENWGIYEPTWVSIDIVRQTNDSAETVFGAVLNICIDEGDSDTDNLRHISFVLGIMSNDFRQVLIRSTAMVDSLFGCPIMNDVNLWENGAVIATGSLFDATELMFNED